MRTEKDLPWLAEPLRQLRDGQRGHALILQGGIGAGLLELALRLAQAWLCEQPPGPCDQCAGCHLALAHTHPDLKVLMPEAWQQRLEWLGEEEGGAAEDGSKSKKKPSREIKVEAVRQAIDWSHTSNARGQAKVLVLFPADAMNAVAANALLKTLEEPAPGTKVLLAVEDPEHLLPTLRSRCQRARLSPPDEAGALAWLGQQGLAQPQALLRAAGGQPLGALELASQGMSGEAWAGLPRQLAQGDWEMLVSWPLPQALHTLQCLCHDLMARSCGGTPRYFPTEALPAVADWAALSAWSLELQRVRRHEDHPWQAGLVLESLLGQLQPLLRRRASRAGAA